MRPFELLSPLFSFSSSRYGIRIATAFFITRALLTTCGRNILPDPKRSPTKFIPSMRGPSIIERGLLYLIRASSTSRSIKSTIPFIRECFSRSSTGSCRHSSSFTSDLSSRVKVLAYSTSRSVESGLRFRSTSSTLSRSSLGISS